MFIYAIVDLCWVFWTVDIQPHASLWAVLAGWLTFPSAMMAQQQGVPQESPGTVAALVGVIIVLGGILLKMLGWIGPKNGNGRPPLQVPFCPAAAELKFLTAEIREAIVQSHKDVLTPYFENLERILERQQVTLDQRHAIFDSIMANQARILESLTHIMAGQVVGTTQSVTLTNTGNTTLTISSITISGSQFVFTGSNTCGSTLSELAACTITVAPTVNGNPATTSFTVAGNGTPATVSATLAASGIVPGAATTVGGTAGIQ